MESEHEIIIIMLYSFFSLCFKNTSERLKQVLASTKHTLQEDCFDLQVLLLIIEKM